MAKKDENRKMLAARWYGAKVTVAAALLLATRLATLPLSTRPPACCPPLLSCPPLRCHPPPTCHTHTYTQHHHNCHTPTTRLQDIRVEEVPVPLVTDPQDVVLRWVGLV